MASLHIIVPKKHDCLLAQNQDVHRFPVKYRGCYPKKTTQKQDLTDQPNLI